MDLTNLQIKTNKPKRNKRRTSPNNNGNAIHRKQQQEEFSTPKPQNIDITHKEVQENQNKKKLLDQARENSNEQQEDVISILEKKFQTNDLTPEQNHRLQSLIQKISPQIQNSIPKTPQTRVNSSQVFSTPQFRQSTPLRPFSFTPTIQKNVATSPNIKKPIPIYSPMTPTQHIKQIAFRSTQTTPVSLKQIFSPISLQ